MLIRNWLWAIAGCCWFGGLSGWGAIAQPPSLIPVRQEQAGNETLSVDLYDGRGTVIDFAATEQTITSIFLADPSEVTYTTDYPLESNQAQAIFLRPIEPLNFDDLPSTVVTNLIVRTRHNAKEFMYVFNLVPQSQAGNSQASGIRIVPEGRMDDFSTAMGEVDRGTTGRTLQIQGNTTATVDDIAVGLQRAIERGYTAPDDPIVRQVRSLLALMRNEPISFSQAAQRQGLSLLLLTRLAEIGLEPVSENLPQSRRWQDFFRQVRSSAIAGVKSDLL